MTSRLEDITRRKQALADKAAQERAELAAAYARIKSPLVISSTLLGLGRTLKTHPVIAAGVSSFLVSGYAGRLLKSASELLRLWKLTLPIWHWWTRWRKAT